jgi:hypothetical protein
VSLDHRWLHSPKQIPAGQFHPAICFACGADKKPAGNDPCPGELPRCETCKCVVTRCRCERDKELARLAHRAQQPRL